MARRPGPGTGTHDPNGRRATGPARTAPGTGHRAHSSGRDAQPGRAVRGFDPDGEADRHPGDFDPFAGEPDTAGHPDDADDPDGGAEPGGWGWFPVSKPRLPADGIKARSQRGAIATTWWSRRFLAAIETPETASRLTRGKSYARTGQVLSLEIDHAEVRAAVQGSRPKPYAVHLTVPIYRPAEQERIIAALAGQAAFSAALLAGQMPEEIEEVLRPLRLSLFPAMHELDIDCSCPDWGNPCKHAAAVCFLLAERFDQDPFDILRWRGLPREELLAGLREHRAQRIGTLPPELPAADDTGAELDRFWDARELPPLPPVPDLPDGHVLRRLGPTGIAVRGVDLATLLAPAYEAMAAARHLPTDDTAGR